MHKLFCRKKYFRRLEPRGPVGPGGIRLRRGAAGHDAGTPVHKAGSGTGSPDEKNCRVGRTGSDRGEENAGTETDRKAGSCGENHARRKAGSCGENHARRKACSCRKAVRTGSETCGSEAGRKETGSCACSVCSRSCTGIHARAGGKTAASKTSRNGTGRGLLGRSA